MFPREYNCDDEQVDESPNEEGPRDLNPGIAPVRTVKNMYRPERVHRLHR